MNEPENNRSLTVTVLWNKQNHLAVTAPDRRGSQTFAASGSAERARLLRHSGEGTAS
jgi:hypothetical protein